MKTALLLLSITGLLSGVCFAAPGAASPARPLVPQSKGGINVVGHPGPGKTSKSGNVLMRPGENMQKNARAFTKDNLNLQKQAQNDQKRMNALNKILKTKHETVRNSIDNVR